MPDYLQMMLSRDEVTERMVINGILGSRRIRPHLRPEYFCGDEKSLILDLFDQWNEYGEIDPDLLIERHGTTILRCDDLGTVTSDSAIDILKQRWIEREIAKTVLQAKTNGKPLDMARDLQKHINHICLADSASSGEYNHSEAVKALGEAINRAHEAGKQIAGYTTGLGRLDSTLGGIERGKLYVLAGLKKTGKSRFMVYLAIQLCGAGAKVLINSMEMSQMQLNTCALGFHSGINTMRLGTAMGREEYQEVEGGLEELKAMSWSIYREKNVPDLRSRIASEKAKTGVDVVFVDYIQRMRGVRHTQRAQEVEEISMDLADLSREENVAVIALSQLQGIAERLKKDQVPDMSHVKESQGIAENADSIIIMHNDNRKQTQFEGGQYVLQPIRFRVEQRYGLSGRVVRAKGDLRTCRFYDAADDRKADSGVSQAAGGGRKGADEGVSPMGADPTGSDSENWEDTEPRLPYAD